MARHTSTTSDACELAGGVARPLRVAACLLVVGVAGIAAACSSSSSSSTTTTTSTSTTHSGSAGLSTSEVKTLQTDLKKVGCFSGTVDGILGPMTTQALRNFQSASHLAVDGIYGPNSQGVLTSAAGAGTRVCVSSSVSTTTTSTAASTTTSTSATTAAAPCTAAAISAALQPGETLNTYQCGGGWAAGSWTNSMYTAAYLLRSSNGVWVQPPTNACANATALDIPANVLDVSPCKVS